MSAVSVQISGVHGAEGKTAILVGCDHNEGKPGVVVMKEVAQITQESVRVFALLAILPGQTLPTDDFAALKVLTE